jgi:hypothetical protein
VLRPRASRRPARSAIARRAAYDAYLTSRTWRARRRAWYAAWLTSHGSPPRCLACDRVWCPRTGHLHHLTYIRLGREDNEDLVPLCATDHRQLHRVLDGSPSWRRLGRTEASLGIIAVMRRRQVPATRLAR